MKEPDRSSPQWTFVAEFEDGAVTRMTTFCANGVADLERGIVLSRAAYESRTGNRKPPPLAKAKFVEPGHDDTVVKEYDKSELKKAEWLVAARRQAAEAERAEAERRRIAEAERLDIERRAVEAAEDEGSL